MAHLHPAAAHCVASRNFAVVGLTGRDDLVRAVLGIARPRPTSPSSIGGGLSSTTDSTGVVVLLVIVSSIGGGLSSTTRLLVGDFRSAGAIDSDAPDETAVPEAVLRFVRLVFLACILLVLLAVSMICVQCTTESEIVSHCDRGFSYSRSRALLRWPVPGSTSNDARR